VEPAFQEEFVAAINIPHAVDPFPHLEPVLATARAQWPAERLAAVEALSSHGRTRRTSQEERAARRARRGRQSAP
jgi:uncharacterized 2Fe-2S/4Fe-4S cluster protein (DUF4445 family)